MPAPPLPMRPDFDGRKLRMLAGTTRAFDLRKRLLALAEIYDGHPRGHVADMAGVSLQTLRSWVMRFNLGGPDALRNNYNLTAIRSNGIG